MTILRYEYIETNEENKKIYAVISSDGNSSENLTAVPIL